MTTVFGSLRNLIVNNCDLVLVGGAGWLAGRCLRVYLPGGKLERCLKEYEERMKEDREVILQNEREEERQWYLQQIQRLRGQIAALENQKHTDRC